MALAPGDKAVRVKLSDGFGAYPCTPVLDVGNRAVRARVSGGLTAIKASLRNIVGVNGYRIPCQVSDTETRAAVNLRWTDHWSRLDNDYPDANVETYYALRGASAIGKYIYTGTRAKWLRYDTHAMEWAELTAFGGIGYAAQAVVSATSDHIFVLWPDSAYTYPRRYSVSGDSWTTWGINTALDCRNGIAASAVGGKLLCGLTSNYKNRWYSFSDGDPYNTWTRLADFPGTGRSEPIAVAVNGLIYVGLGWSGGPTYYRDLWVYDPSTDGWDSLADCPADIGSSCTAAVLNGQIHVMGSLSTSNYPHYAYNPDTNSWTQKKNFADGDTMAAGGRASVGVAGKIHRFPASTSSSPVTREHWIYDPVGAPWGIA